MSSPATTDGTAPSGGPADVHPNRLPPVLAGTTALLSSAAGRLVTLMLAIALSAAVVGDALNWNRQSDATLQYYVCVIGEESRAYVQAGGLPIGLNGVPYYMPGTMPLDQVTLNEQQQQELTRRIRQQCEPLRPPLSSGVDSVVALTLVLGTGVLLYGLTPYGRILRFGLVRLRRLGNGKLDEQLNTLADVAGARVMFLLDPVETRAGGVAFGHAGRRYICLTAGMIALFDSDRAVFRTVVLHELGHVANHDLDIATFTVALWRSFVGWVLVAGVLMANDLGADREDAWENALGVLVLAAVIHIARNGILRTRELHADAFAAHHAGTADSLAHAVERGERRHSSRWSAVLRWHPRAEERVRALRSPAWLLDLTWLDAVALGVVASMALGMTVGGMNGVIQQWGVRLGLVTIENYDMRPLYWQPRLLVLAPVAMAVAAATLQICVALPWWAAMRRLALTGCLMEVGWVLGDWLTPQGSTLGGAVSIFDLGPRWWEVDHLLATTVVLAVAALCWRAVIQPRQYGRWAAVFALYGALVAAVIGCPDQVTGLTGFPQIGPAVLAGFPLIGVLATLATVMQRRMGPSSSDPVNQRFR
jgi:hypothetical protein